METCNFRNLKNYLLHKKLRIKNSEDLEDSEKKIRGIENRQTANLNNLLKDSKFKDESNLHDYEHNLQALNFAILTIFPIP